MRRGWRMVLGVMVVMVAAVGCGGAGPEGVAGEELWTVGPTQAVEESGLRFLALGDSYTIGEGVAEAERWPAQLAARMRDAGVEVGEVRVVARTGWTTDELSAAMDAAELEGPYDLVSLLIGVNNQYRGRGPLEYRDEFAGLLERAIELAGGEAARVAVLSIPDWGVTPFAAQRDRALITSEIDLFNTLNAEQAARLGAGYVDVTGISRQAGEDVSLLAEDGLHPSGKMYALWAEAVAQAVLPGLQAGRTP